jgi:hypothetical protein
MFDLDDQVGDARIYGYKRRMGCQLHFFEYKRREE